MKKQRRELGCVKCVYKCKKEEYKCEKRYVGMWRSVLDGWKE